MAHDEFAEVFALRLEESAALKRKLLDEQTEIMARIAAALIDAFRNGHAAWFCGNGGSFTDAHHLVGELVGRFAYDRPALRAFVLGSGVAAMTAIANDYGYEQVFAREVRGSVKAGDVVIGLTTSGESANVCEALAAARDLGAVTIGLTGDKRARIDEVADMVLHVPSRSTPRIQECHITVGHVICELVEQTLFPK